MIMDFVPKAPSEYLAKLNYMDKPQQLLYDKIDSAISCNENASDWELHDFIIASHGSIAQLIRQGLEAKSQNVSDLGKEEFEMYRDEMIFFIDRIESHPSMKDLKKEST